MWWLDFLWEFFSPFFLLLFHWDGSQENVSSCACIPNILASFLGVCMCVYVWTCQMMRNKLKMRWFAHFLSLSLSMCGCLCVLCVCLVNLFRLFSLLQTHANEIEWGRMTSIQAQTDSLISRSLSLLSSFSNPALLTDSFFLSAVFFTCLLSFFYSPPCRPPPSHTPGFAQTPSHVHASLKACKQAESLTTMHQPQEGRSHKHCALPGGFASIR